jgi:hypothetical protein
MGGVFNLVNLHVYHYAGNNPLKYTDPDGRSEDKLDLGVYKDIITLGLDMRSGLEKDAPSINQTGLMKMATQMQTKFTNIGESPGQFSAYTLSLTALGAMGYMAYKNDEGVNGFVNSVTSWADELNNSLMDRGVNLIDQSYTVAEDNLGMIKISFGGDISKENVSLTADNMFSFRFNSSARVSAQFGLGVNVPLGPGSRKPDFGNMTPINMGCEIRLKLTL